MSATFAPDQENQPPPGADAPVDVRASVSGGSSREGKGPRLREPTPAMLLSRSALHKNTAANSAKASAALHRLSHAHLAGRRLQTLAVLSRLAPALSTVFAEDNEVHELADGCLPPTTRRAFLQNNRLTTLAPLFKRQGVPALERLAAGRNFIEAIDDDCFQGCDRVQELSLAHQTIAHPLVLSPLALRSLASSLRVLDVSHCLLETLSPLAVLAALERLNASCNCMSQFEDSVLDCLVGCKRLQSLRLAENPLCVAELRYKDACLAVGGDDLLEVDGMAVTRQQRDFIKRVFVSRWKRNNGAM